MKITYDPAADAIYIYFSKNRKSTRTEELKDDFLADYAGKELIGIEVLNVSNKLPKKELENAAAIFPISP